MTTLSLCNQGFSVRRRASEPWPVDYLGEGGGGPDPDRPGGPPRGGQAAGHVAAVQEGDQVPVVSCRAIYSETLNPKTYNSENLSEVESNLEVSNGEIQKRWTVHVVGLKPQPNPLGSALEEDGVPAIGCGTPIEGPPSSLSFCALFWNTRLRKRVTAC